MRIFDFPNQPSLPRKTVAAVTLAAVVGATATAMGTGSEVPSHSSAAQDLVDASIADSTIAAQHRTAAAGRAAAGRAATETSGQAVVMKAVSATTVSGTSPSAAKATAKSMLLARGWGSRQYRCLVTLWERESNWNYRATNRSSGAYGLAQALPARKMASAGADWRTNPATQITWGLGYIADRYRTPCGALAHSRATGWY